MKKTLRAFCNFFVTIFFVILMIYISFFTDIPTKTGNVIRLKIEEIKNEQCVYTSEFVINELGIKNNTYYFNTLNDEQKKIYTAIANSVKKYDNEFAVRDYVAGDKEAFAKEVSIAIEAFINDHPEVFYLQSQYSSYVLSGFKGNIGYVKLNYTEIKIHDKLAYNVTYSDLDELPRKYHTAEGTLIENIGVCDGFTKALQLIYDKAGIESIIVLGTLDGNPHAWNLVKIEDNWYNVDITSSRSILSETGVINHAYFNLTNQKMKRIATFDNEELIPKTDSTKYDFYEYNNYMINAEQDITQQMRSIHSSFTDKSYMEFYFIGDVADNISNMLMALKRIDSTFLDGTKMYYYNIENAIIIPRN